MVFLRVIGGGLLLDKTNLVGDWSTSQFCKKLAETCSYQLCMSFNSLCHPDVVDIKPTNMEELTEVITASIFHPVNCNEFVYSSSKGTIRLCDMREKALCDAHAKSKVGERAMKFSPNSNLVACGKGSSVEQPYFW